MSKKNFSFQTLITPSSLSLWALLFGITFAVPSQAMEEQNFYGRISPIKKLEEYKDLINSSFLPLRSLQPGDLLLINVGHGLVHACTSISESNTEANLFQRHKNFMEVVLTISEEDYHKVVHKSRLVIKETGLPDPETLIKIGEKGLPDFLDTLSAQGTYIIPISSRGDIGKNATEETSAILSRTEEEFKTLGYNWENWVKPASLQGPNTELFLQDDSPDTHGTYKLRNGIIYSHTHPKPHKSAALVGLVNLLKEAENLPSAIFITDREKTINEIFEDLRERDFGIPIYPFNHTQHKAFKAPEDLKNFYTWRLGEKLQDYKQAFKVAFEQDL